MTEHDDYWQHDQTIIDLPFPLPERFLEQAGYHHGGRFGGRAEDPELRGGRGDRQEEGEGPAAARSAGPKVKPG